MNKVTPPEFLEWLDAELDKRHWNDSQASQLAGLNKSAISEIRRGMRPGPKKVRALARLFNAPEEYVFRLAGHLSNHSTDTDHVYRIQELAERVSRLPPERQRRVMEAFLTMLEGEEIREDYAQGDQETVLPESRKNTP